MLGFGTFAQLTFAQAPAGLLAAAVDTPSGRTASVLSESRVASIAAQSRVERPLSELRGVSLGAESRARLSYPKHEQHWWSRNERARMGR
jgi:hypothetical protein